MFLGILENYHSKWVSDKTYRDKFFSDSKEMNREIYLTLVRSFRYIRAFNMKPILVERLSFFCNYLLSEKLLGYRKLRILEQCAIIADDKLAQKLKGDANLQGAEELEKGKKKLEELVEDLKEKVGAIRNEIKEKQFFLRIERNMIVQQYRDY